MASSAAWRRRPGLFCRWISDRAERSGRVSAGDGGADQRVDLEQQLDLRRRTEYDIAAASYDAAVRDALPGTTGSQPLLFVFAGGQRRRTATTTASAACRTPIRSPGTAKNVITVGRVEQPRNITNDQ